MDPMCAVCCPCAFQSLLFLRAAASDMAHPSASNNIPAAQKPLYAPITSRVLSPTFPVLPRSTTYIPVTSHPILVRPLAHSPDPTDTIKTDQPAANDEDEDDDDKNRDRGDETEGNKKENDSKRGRD